MKLLLARGANPKTGTAERTELLRLVYGERPEIRPILAAAGVNARESTAVALPLTTSSTMARGLCDSRAFGFQPYFETGFPHRVDQFISASATGWAILALTNTL